MSKLSFYLFKQIVDKSSLAPLSRNCETKLSLNVRAKQTVLSLRDQKLFTLFFYLLFYLRSAKDINLAFFGKRNLQHFWPWVQNALCSATAFQTFKIAKVSGLILHFKQGQTVKEKKNGEPSLSNICFTFFARFL